MTSPNQWDSLARRSSTGATARIRSDPSLGPSLLATAAASLSPAAAAMANYKFPTKKLKLKLNGKIAKV